jgi:hypothetical protein
MFHSRLRRQSLVWLAVVGICLPLPALAAESNLRSADGATDRGAWRVVDVELRPGGMLVGQVLDAGAQPVSDADISILSGDSAVASTRTDASGLFAVTGLRGGMHQVQTNDTAQVCRLWAPGTAPPTSPSAVQIVTGDEIVRGQWGPPPGNGFLKNAKVWATNPFVIGGVVAAAVAIPVAIHNADDDDDGPAS